MQTGWTLRVRQGARRKGKDSVFLDLFGIPRYGAQMADALHPELAIEETIRICQSEDVLADYLKERKKEVRDIMMTLFDQEEVTKRYGYEMKEEGRAERDVLSIRNLMETMGLPMEKAMDALKIPMQDRERYAAALRP